MNKPQLRDLVLGATLGMAAGEALGWPFRQMQRHQVEAKFAEVEDIAGQVGKGYTSGHWGGQTAQMLAVMESYAAGGEFDGEDLALRLVSIADSPHAGYDEDTLRIIDAYRQNPDLYVGAARKLWMVTAGTFASNGALCRGTIAAIKHLHHVDLMIADTIRLCHLTHFDPRSVEASLAINFLLNRCLASNYHSGLIDQVAGFVRGLEGDKNFQDMALKFDSDELAARQNMTPLPTYLEDRDAVVRELARIPKMTRDDLIVSGNAVHSMQVAIWALVHSKSYEQGVASVVSLGGHTDVQGALAGALLGARFGFPRIPANWMKVLEDRARIVNVTEFLVNDIQAEDS